MTLERRTIPLADGQSVSAVVAYPAGFTVGNATVVILAHGAGNDMQSPFLSAVHEGLAARGYVTVKFNFPYTERGRRAPDRAPVLEACYRSVLDAVRADRDIEAPRVVIGGKSMGGRMATHLAAQGAEVAGVLLLGYPLHPAGKPQQLRVAHLDRIRVPMLFFAGTRDALCNLALLRETLKRLPAPVALHIVDGGDHSFKVPKSMQRQPAAVWDEIIAASADWLARVVCS
jgi:predicted alpha/beta-hydrolase family hydrolase